MVFPSLHQIKNSNLILIPILLNAQEDGFEEGGDGQKRISDEAGHLAVVMIIIMFAGGQHQPHHPRDGDETGERPRDHQSLPNGSIATECRKSEKRKPKNRLNPFGFLVQSVFRVRHARRPVRRPLRLHDVVDLDAEVDRDAQERDQGEHQNDDFRRDYWSGSHLILLIYSRLNKKYFFKLKKGFILRCFNRF